MHFTMPERLAFGEILRGWSDRDQALQMRQYIQHGRVTTYDHCVRVALVSFWLNRRLPFHCDEVPGAGGFSARFLPV